MNSIRHYARRIRGKLYQLQSQVTFGNSLGFQMLPDDIFLVSYPRSGNTWVRFLLANLYAFSEQRIVDFHTVHQYVPDTHIREHRSTIESLPRPRILKTHRPFTREINRVIYLLRDGRDVYLSYYHYLVNREKFQGDFSTFLMTDTLQFGTWFSHVESWLFQDRCRDLLLVRYETLLEEPEVQLLKIADFVGLTTSQKQIEYAVQQSTFIEMQKTEDKNGEQKEIMNSRFVRRGRAGEWRNAYSAEQITIFKARSNQLLVKLGYETSPDW